MACAFARFGRRGVLALAIGVLILGCLSEHSSARAADPSAEQVVQGLAEDIWFTLRTNGVDD